MAKVIFLAGVLVTFAVGSVAATETGLLMPMPLSLAQNN
jgi:hypothetical protein